MEASQSRRPQEIASLCAFISENAYINGERIPCLVRDMIFGGIEHYSTRCLMQGGTLDVETSTDQMLDVILRGIQVPQKSDDGSST